MGSLEAVLPRFCRWRQVETCFFGLLLLLLLLNVDGIGFGRFFPLGCDAQLDLGRRWRIGKGHENGDREFAGRAAFEYPFGWGNVGIVAADCGANVPVTG